MRFRGSSRRERVAGSVNQSGGIGAEGRELADELYVKGGVRERSQGSFFLWCLLWSTFRLFVQTILHACVCPIAKSCLTLCNPMDYHPPSSSVHGIFQVRILEWIAIFSFGDLSHPVIKPTSPISAASAAGSLPLSQLGSPFDYGAFPLFSY